VEWKAHAVGIFTAALQSGSIAEVKIEWPFKATITLLNVVE